MIETDSYGSLKMAVNEINDRQDKDQNILVRKATAKPSAGQLSPRLFTKDQTQKNLLKTDISVTRIGNPFKK